MSSRIVFNGHEYDGVEDMPADVRQQYETALQALSAADRKLMDAAEHGSGVSFKLNVQRRFKINGKEYGSVEEMPPDVRALYEQALAANPSLRVTASTPITPRGTPIVPPAIDAGEDRRAAVWRRVLWVAAICAVLLWLLLKR